MSVAMSVPGTPYQIFQDHFQAYDNVVCVSLCVCILILSSVSVYAPQQAGKSHSPTYQNCKF